MRKTSVIFFLLIAIAGKALSQGTSALYDAGTKPQLIAKQFLFTEGPAVDKHGNVFFTDQPNNKIWK